MPPLSSLTGRSTSFLYELLPRFAERLCGSLSLNSSMHILGFLLRPKPTMNWRQISSASKSWPRNWGCLDYHEAVQSQGGARWLEETYASLLMQAYRMIRAEGKTRKSLMTVS